MLEAEENAGDIDRLNGLKGVVRIFAHRRGRPLDTSIVEEGVDGTQLRAGSLRVGGDVLGAGHVGHDVDGLVGAKLLDIGAQARGVPIHQCDARAPGDEAAAVELTFNWDPEPYSGGRNFGHLAYAVDNIYDTCSAFIAHDVTINRPPRDGRMAFVRTPDGISIELLQAGDALAPAEPWTSMPKTGSW